MTRRRFPLRLGQPAINYFPLPLWRRLLDNVLREEGSSVLGCGDSAGEWPAKGGDCPPLALSRGINCDARQIVITEGALEGVNLCTQLLSVRGKSRGLKNRVISAQKARLFQPDWRSKAYRWTKGMKINRDLPAPAPFYPLPSHQYPTGSVLSAVRRLALLEYACQNGAWIVEDDYDSEFRFSGEPIPAMRGMVDNAPVVYLGTFNKRYFRRCGLDLWCCRQRWWSRRSRWISCAAAWRPSCRAARAGPLY